MMMRAPNLLFALVNLFMFGLVLLWPILSVVALVGLRQRPLASIAKALWAALVVGVPILGAVAYWIVDPQPDAA
ncbi:MAG: hypothetical protein GX552_04520 [Chloroflexi bacterium]|jgi:uncharacterized membrane protein YhaH (DUF805 family)|nr:hypothetical protein [Chloroflexota bacterium]